MYCRECGHQLAKGTTTCPNCYSKPLASKKYCQNCGSETYESHEFCVRCNVNLIYLPEEEEKKAAPTVPTTTQKREYQHQSNPSTNRPNYQKTVIDEPNDLANFASACCWNPIIGIVLYLVWKDEKPRAAESVCHWTIGGFVLSIIGSILYMIFIASIAG